MLLSFVLSLHHRQDGVIETPFIEYDYTIVVRPSYQLLHKSIWIQRSTHMYKALARSEGFY